MRQYSDNIVKAWSYTVNDREIPVYQDFGTDIAIFYDPGNINFTVI